jgi:hypothetical protein
MPLGRAPLSGHPSHLAVGRWPLAVGPLRGPLAAPPPLRLATRAAVGGSAGGWRPGPAVGGERLCSMFHVPPLILRGVGGCKKNLKSLSRKKKLIGAGALKPAPNLEHGTRDTTVDATASHAWRSRSERGGGSDASGGIEGPEGRMRSRSRKHPHPHPRAGVAEPAQRPHASTEGRRSTTPMVAT